MAHRFLRESFELHRLKRAHSAQRNVRLATSKDASERDGRLIERETLDHMQGRRE